MSIRRKIWLIPILATLIFGLGMGLVLFTSSTTLTTIAGVGEIQYPFLDTTNRLISQVELMKSTFTAAVGEGEKKRLDEAKEQASTIRKMLEDSKRFSNQSQPVSALSEDFEACFASSLDTSLMMLGEKSGDSAVAIKQMQAAWKKLEETLQSASDTSHGEFAQALKGAEDGVRSSLYATIASGMVVVIAIVIASKLVVASVWSQLGGEPEYARSVVRVVAQGDLSQEVSLEVSDRSSLLAGIEEMTSGLRSIVSSVRQSSDAITEAARDIASGNHDLSTRTEVQASSLARTAQRMAEITKTIQQNANSSRLAINLSTSATEVADKGGKVMEQVIATMKSIDSSSKKISEIIGVIDAIAFQTNILALNAAVEAARAGQHGRGFAVVASEVRSLAGRSAQAAKEISSLIKASVAEVESGSVLVKSAGETMVQIMQSVQQVEEIITEIAGASREQAMNVAEAGTSISEMDESTQQNAAMVQQASAAASSLERQAEDLSLAMAKFKLSTSQGDESTTFTFGQRSQRPSHIALMHASHS